MNPVAVVGAVGGVMLALMMLLLGSSYSPLRDPSQPHLDPKSVYRGTPWMTSRTVSVRTLGQTPFARCDVHAVRSEDGASVVNDWIFFEERDAVNVAVQNAAGKFVAFRQRKYAIPGESFAPVGGFVDDGESPYDAARREVREELGLGSRREAARGEAAAPAPEGGGPGKGQGETKGEVPLDPDGLPDGRVLDADPDWIYLGSYRTAANRGAGFLHAYYLRNAVPVAPNGGTSAFRGTGDDEEQNLVLLDEDEVRRLSLRGGAFKEIKWAATFGLALLHLLQADGI